MPKSEIVLKGALLTPMSSSKAWKVIVGVPGLESAWLSQEDKRIMVVTGDGIDSVELTMLLRKELGSFELLSLGPVEYGGEPPILESNSAAVDKFFNYKEIRMKIVLKVGKWVSKCLDDVNRFIMSFPGREKHVTFFQDGNNLIVVLTGYEIDAVELTMRLGNDLNPVELLSIGPLEYQDKPLILARNCAGKDKYVTYEKLKDHSGPSRNTEHVPGTNSPDRQQIDEIISDDEIDLT